MMMVAKITEIPLVLEPTAPDAFLDEEATLVPAPLELDGASVARRRRLLAGPAEQDLRAAA